MVNRKVLESADFCRTFPPFSNSLFTHLFRNFKLTSNYFRPKFHMPPCESLQELRYHSADQIRSNRNDVTHMRIGKLEKMNAALNAQIHHLEFTLEEDKSRCGQKAAELKTIRKEMESILKKITCHCVWSSLPSINFARRRRKWKRRNRSVRSCKS